MPRGVESLHEVARFLRGVAPFDAMPEDELDTLAGAATIVFAAAGDEVFAQGAAPAEGAWVVRRGLVELIDGDDVVDQLGAGEVFGARSLMTGMPVSVTARAVEDTLLYRLAGDVVRPLLARPEGMRYVARTLLARSAGPPVAAGPAAAPVDLALAPIGRLAREPALTCTPEVTVRDAAAQMTAAGRSAIVIALADGSHGVLTDSDLRARVLCGPVAPDDPVTAAMTAPAITVTEDRRGADVLLEMLGRNIHHVPVVGDDGRIVAIARPDDLLAAQTRAPLVLREAIARAATVAAVAAAAAQRGTTVIALHDAGLDAAHIGALLTALDDAVLRRLVELGHAELGAPPAPVGWLVFGSLARHEAVPSSDVDCGLYWAGADDDADAEAWARRLAGFVLDGLDACGLRADDNGIRADNPLVARSLERWRTLIDGLAADPGQTNAMALVSVLADGRALTGPVDAAGLFGFVGQAVHRPEVLALLRRVALQASPVRGLLHGAVPLPGGASPKQLDLKHRGINVIVDLARWAGIAAGVTSNGTQERLRGAAAAGVLADADARALIEAHVLLSTLRLDHQVAQLRAGAPVDDVLDGAALDPLTRTYVRDALRAIATVQRHAERQGRAP